MLIIFTFFFSRKTLFKKYIARLWKWDGRSMESRLRKLNYFSTLIGISWLVTFATSISLIIFVLLWCMFIFGVFHAFIISLGNATTKHAQQNTTKKCEKEILMKFMTSNRIQLCNAMQLLYMHCIHTTLISISMTMQLANSAILTGRSVLSASVFWFALFSFSLWNVSRCSQAAVIIFDNFSDKKITRDKLLQLIEY